MTESKLDQTLDIQELENLHDELELNLPENPQLKDVAQIALQSYKTQMENLIHIEPKNRQRHLEVACQYLNVAREAIKQEEELRIKENKEKGVYQQINSQETTKTDNSVSREELFKKRNQKKSGT